MVLQSLNRQVACALTTVREGLTPFAKGLVDIALGADPFAVNHFALLAGQGVSGSVLAGVVSGAQPGGKVGLLAVGDNAPRFGKEFAIWEADSPVFLEPLVMLQTVSVTVSWGVAVNDGASARHLHLVGGSVASKALVVHGTNFHTSIAFPVAVIHVA